MKILNFPLASLGRDNSDEGCYMFGSKIYDCCSSWVSYLWVWKTSPKNPQIFNFFASGQKKYHWVRSNNIWVNDRSAPFILQVKSMLGSGQGPSLDGDPLIKAKILST